MNASSRQILIVPATHPGATPAQLGVKRFRSIRAKESDLALRAIELFVCLRVQHPVLGRNALLGQPAVSGGRL
jgi:hypothetical protein